MAKFRKKPVVVEAIQWTGENLMAVYEFIGEPVKLEGRIDHEKWDEYVDLVKERGFCIVTLEGTMVANISDYIIKGVQGEFYPCKPAIFEATYEKVFEPDFFR